MTCDINWLVIYVKTNKTGLHYSLSAIQGSSYDGPDPFCEKTINVLLKWTLFLTGPHIQALQISYQLCSNVDIKDSWANQILQRADKNFKWSIKI